MEAGRQGSQTLSRAARGHGDKSPGSRRGFPPSKSHLLRIKLKVCTTYLLSMLLLIHASLCLLSYRNRTQHNPWMALSEETLARWMPSWPVWDQQIAASLQSTAEAAEVRLPVMAFKIKSKLFFFAKE